MSKAALAYQAARNDPQVRRNRARHLMIGIGLVASVTGVTSCHRSEPAAGSARAVGAAPAVEVMHWLTSDHDAAALAIVRNSLTDHGVVWHDTPMPGAGAVGRTAAVSRIVGGKPPDVFQFSLGSALQELAAQQLVAPVPGDTRDWDTTIPAVIRTASQHNGQYFAVPVAVRGENWLFYNKAVLRQAGVAVPRNWSEVLSAVAQLKAAGKIPLALGGQPWQERLLFNAVLLGVGGRDFYRGVYERKDPALIDSPTMLEVFDIFGALRGAVDQGSPGRRWSQTTLLLTHGDAAFQIMGDWVKPEIRAAGLEPGREIGCVLAPGQQEAYIMMVDAFAFAASVNPAVRNGQLLFARALQDPAIQAEFTRRLDAIPARSDVPDTGFDVCAAHAMTVMRDPQAQLMDPGLTLPGGLSGAIDDTLSRYWNDRNMSPAQGRALLRDAFFTGQ